MSDSHQPTIVVRRRGTRRPWVVWGLAVVMVLAILFAAFCHKHQLETLGRRLTGDD